MFKTESQEMIFQTSAVCKQLITLLLKQSSLALRHHTHLVPAPLGVPLLTPVTNPSSSLNSLTLKLLRTLSWTSSLFHLFPH